jgi:DNA repair protein RadC
MNNPLKSVVPTIGKAVATKYHELVHEAKRIIEKRNQAQRNWENRKDNSNYYGSYKDFE